MFFFQQLRSQWQCSVREEYFFNVLFCADPSQISELLSKTISDAHARTCLYSLEHIHDMFRKPHDLSRLLYYKNMAHEELWLECAQKLTTVIQQIIEFAKMVPGFMKLSQDDQIVLLKAGSFELAVLRMSRYLDLAHNCVLYGDTMLPQEAFFTTDTAEMKLVTCVFELSKSVAELKLTETELALYSACVLLSPGIHFKLICSFNILFVFVSLQQVPQLFRC